MPKTNRTSNTVPHQHLRTRQSHSKGEARRVARNASPSNTPLARVARPANKSLALLAGVATVLFVSIFVAYYKNLQSSAVPFNLENLLTNPDDLDVCLTGCQNKGKKGAQCHMLEFKHKANVETITKGDLARFEKEYPGRTFKTTFITKHENGVEYGMFCCPDSVDWKGVLSIEDSKKALASYDSDSIYKHHLALGNLSIGYQLLNYYTGEDVSGERKAIIKEFSKFHSSGEIDFRLLDDKRCTFEILEDICLRKKDMFSSALKIKCENNKQ